MNHVRPVGRAMTAAGLLTLGFILVPLPFIVGYAFTPNAGAVWSSPTLRWFANFFANDRFMAAARTSLGVAAIATVASLLLAVPTAVVAVRARFVGKGVLMAMVSAPLLVPGVIIGIAALSAVAQSGAGPGFWPITVAMICLALPLALRPLVANLSGLDADLEKAARNLGAGPVRAFMAVTLPQLTPGLVAGGTFAFVEAMDNFSVAVFLSDIQTTTLPVEAYSYIREVDDPTVAAMATLLVLLSVVFVMLIEWALGLDRFLDMS